jgi:glycosyltransferase involved in cell wall biosynthesis
MIVKNEEKNIARCIKSYKNVVNEIIVVDTGSTDKTIEEAQKLGAKVYRYQWNNDFAAAKNYALDRAKGEWIVFLDADEYFEKGKEVNLPRLIKNVDNKKDIDGLMVKMVNIEGLEDEVIDLTIVVRAFRNHKNIRFHGNIHEAIMNKEENIRCQLVDEKDLRVFHTGYSSEIIDYKFERNLRLLESNISDGKIRPLDYIYLCDCYMSQHKYDKVIKYAREYLKLDNNAPGYNSKPYQLLINAMNQAGVSTDELKKEIDKAIMKFPYHPEFYRYLAAVYSAEKKYQLALETYLKTLKLQDEYNDIEVNNVSSTLFDVYYNIGVLYEHKNDNLKALDSYYKSLQLNKYNDLSFSSLIIMLKTEKTGDIVMLLNSIYNDCEEDVKFIISSLMRIKHGELLLHYYNIWNKVYKKEDVALMYVFLSNGYYEKAFNMFYDAFLLENAEEYKILAIVSAVLSNDAHLIKKVIDIVDDVYANIINLCLGKESILLQRNNIVQYINVLNEIVQVSSNKEVLNNYLIRIDGVKSVEFIFKVVEILKKNSLYDYAINIISNNLLNFEGEFKSKAYYEMGICYYKLINYEKSIKCFEDALDLGYSIEPILCCLKWIKNIYKNTNDIDYILTKYSSEKDKLV